MDMETIGFYLYMEEQEKKKKQKQEDEEDKENQQHSKFNVDLKRHLVAELPTYTADLGRKFLFSRNIPPVKGAFGLDPNENFDRYV